MTGPLEMFQFSEDWIKELSDSLQELEKKNQDQVEASRKWTKALEDGLDSDPFRKLVESTASDYKNFQTRVGQRLKEIRQKFFKIAENERKRGVDFPYVSSEMDPIRDTAFAPLKEEIQITINALRNFIDTVDKYNELTSSIQARFEQIKKEMDRLNWLQQDVSTDSQRFHTFQEYNSDLSYPKKELAREINIYVGDLLQRVEEAVKQKSSDTTDAVVNALDRLQVLGEKKQDDETRCMSLLETLANDNASDDDLKALLTFQKELELRIEQVLINLNHQINQVILAARVLLDQLHPTMPEWIQLHTMTSNFSTIQESELNNYLQQLERAIEEGQSAGHRELQEYEKRFQSVPGFRFETPEEAERLGYALLQEAGNVKEIKERLWILADDTLMRVMDSNQDMIEYYNKFGYRIVGKALDTALDQNCLISSLNFLERDFLPQDIGTKEDRILKLFNQLEIKEVVKRAINSSAFRLDPEQIKNMDMQIASALMSLYPYASSLGIPPVIQLQWLAALLRFYQGHKNEYVRARRYFLYALADTQQYLNLYYALVVLTEDDPTLWWDPKFRPLLRDLAVKSLDWEKTQKCVLPELLSLMQVPEICKLVEGDFGWEYTLIAINHYIAIRTGISDLTVWEAWERQRNTFPILINLLLNQLEGRPISIKVAPNLNSARQELRAITMKLETVVNSQTKIGLRGVRLAESIYKWYMEKYMRPWYSILCQENPKIEQLDLVDQEIAELEQEESLTDFCPYQREPPDPAFHGPIMGALRDQLDRRLKDIMDSFKQMVIIHRLLSSKNSDKIVIAQDLNHEVAAVRNRSPQAFWALEHILLPILPLYDLNGQRYKVGVENNV